MQMLKVSAIVVLTATTALALPANDNSSLSARSLSCYADGEIWGDQLEEALKFAEMACTELRGTYDHDEVAATCFPMSDQKHVKFRIRRTEAPQSDMPEEDCIEHLDEQINDCPRGGEGLWPGWAIRADPQSGSSC